VHAAAVLELDRHVLVREVVAQQLDREAVARAKPEDDGRLAQRALDLELELGGHVADHRREPRGDALLGPQERLAERREARAAPAAHLEDRGAERPFALARDAPGEAIGKPQLPGGALQVPFPFDGREQRQQPSHDRVELRASVEHPLRLDRDLQAASLLKYAIPYIRFRGAASYCPGARANGALPAGTRIAPRSSEAGIESKILCGIQQRRGNV